MAHFIELQESVVLHLLKKGDPDLLTAYMVMVKARDREFYYSRAGAKAISKVINRRHGIGKAKLRQLQAELIPDENGEQVGILQSIEEGNRRYNTTYKKHWGRPPDCKSWYLTPAKDRSTIKVSWVALTDATGRDSFVQSTLQSKLTDEEKIDRLAVMIWFFKHWDALSYNGFDPQATAFCTSLPFSEGVEADSILAELDGSDLESFDRARVEYSNFRWRLINARWCFRGRSAAIKSCSKWLGRQEAQADIASDWYLDAVEAMYQAWLIRPELVVLSGGSLADKPLYTIYRPGLSKEHEHTIQKKGLYSLTAYRPITYELGICDEVYGFLSMGDTNQTGFFVSAHPLKQPDTQTIWVIRLVDQFGNEAGLTADDEEEHRQTNWMRKLELARADIPPASENWGDT